MKIYKLIITASHLPLTGDDLIRNNMRVFRKIPVEQLLSTGTEKYTK